MGGTEEADEKDACRHPVFLLLMSTRSGQRNKSVEKVMGAEEVRSLSQVVRS